MKFKLIIALVVLFSCVLLFLSAQILKGIFLTGLLTILCALAYVVFRRYKMRDKTKR